MKLRLERKILGRKSSIGELFIDNAFFCYTLEDPVREQDGVPVKDWKVPGDSAIPVGTYNVIISESQRFKRELPLVENVPGFMGIRIHPGNDPGDTEGCILVGRTRGDDFVGESRAAFSLLFNEIQTAISEGDDVSIEILNDPERSTIV